MSTIRIEVRDSNGALVDPAAVTLQDETGSFGIKRDDSGILIVTPGTAVVHVSTGIYEYTVDLDPLVNYTAVWRLEYAPDDVEYAVTYLEAVRSIRTLRYYRRELAKLLGGFQLFTVDQDGPDTVTLISAQLRDANLPASAYDQQWAYLASGNQAGKQRQILNGSFSSSQGQVQITPPLDEVVLPGSDIEIHSRLPAIGTHRLLGLRDAINQALGVLWTVDRVPMPGASGELFDLSDTWWLMGRGQLVDVLYQPSSTEQAVRSRHAYNFVYQANTVRLEGPSLASAGATGSYHVAAYRPMNTWIKRDGTWQESVQGLVNDADEALGDPQIVVQTALYFAYLALSMSPFEAKDHRDNWTRQALAQAPIVANLKRHYLPRDDDAGHGPRPYNYEWKGLF